MNLELTTEQAQELQSHLDRSLVELTREIAGTDNAPYKAVLTARHGRLAEVAENLHQALARATPNETAAPRTVPDELIRDLARPGD
jgi:phage tail protein X